ncbi:type II toxin-antitoxin system RelE/ParE family toxin [Pantoea sp. MBD-2R]|uniref:type II toxin-antitoxin system RelE/ParE family toxin n=1 Tax=Pantoea sp. MBD-2R TaxID=3141540 RepID=UPI00318405EC
MAEKEIRWRSTALSDLKRFPMDVIRQAGFELHKVQQGQDPSDFKIITGWGPGVTEIRIRGEDGIYRVMYVAKFEEAIYVLHSFQKKTQKTSPRDVTAIKQRYKDLEHERRINND